jgi:hypothetical protein
MQNPFDEFDEPAPSTARPAAAPEASNPFDEFDEHPAPTLGDYGKALGAGVAGITEALGFGVRKLGAEGIGGELEEAGQTVRQALTTGIDPRRIKEGVTMPAPFDGMSEGGKAALQAPLITDDGELGPTPLSTIALSATESLPGTVAMAVPGLGLTRGLQALKAGEAVTAALGGGKVAQKIGGAVAPGLGFGASEGIFSGAQNAAGIGAQAREASDEQLAQAPGFQAALAATDPSLPLAERMALAREENARAAENEVFGRTALTTGAISAVTGGGAFGQLVAPSGGIVKRTLTGAAHEALQEAPQSGTEAYYENRATGEYLDPTRRPGEGVLNATALGAATGGLLGAATGAVSPAPAAATSQGRGTPPPAPPSQGRGGSEEETVQGEGEVGLGDLDPAQQRHMRDILGGGLPGQAGPPPNPQYC